MHTLVALDIIYVDSQDYCMVLLLHWLCCKIINAKFMLREVSAFAFCHIRLGELRNLRALSRDERNDFLVCRIIWIADF